MFWHLLGASVRNPARDKVMRKEADIRKACSDFRDPLCWTQKRPVPMRVAWGPPGIPLPSMPQPKILCGVGAGT